MPNAWRNTTADVLNKCAYPQEGKSFVWRRVEKEEATQNSALCVLAIDIRKLSRCVAVFLLYPLNVLVAKISNSKEVDGEEYDDNADSRSS